MTVNEKRPVAYQLYSARDDAQKDMDSTLARLAALGYDGIEFAGFYQHSAEEIKKLLSKHGLTAISSHVPLAQIEADMEGVISYHRKIGCQYIAIPYSDDTHRPGGVLFASLIATIYKFASLCKQSDIQLLYHNHDFEFTRISGQYGLDFIYQAVPADLLQTEIDTCWVKYAGIDPVVYLNQYSGRTPVVHLKDYVGRKRDGSTPYALIGLNDDQADKNVEDFEFTPFGHGIQDTQAIIQAAINGGVRWFVIEQDQSTRRTPLEDAALSIETLNRIGIH